MTRRVEIQAWGRLYLTLGSVFHNDTVGLAIATYVKNSIYVILKDDKGAMNLSKRQFKGSIL